MSEQEQEHRDVICKHGKEGYCFDCVRERHNEDVLDGRFDEDTTTNHTETQGLERDDVEAPEGIWMEIGWAKADLDRLEALWWEYHDEWGNLTI
jgi:hypothetical protein